MQRDHRRARGSAGPGRGWAAARPDRRPARQGQAHGARAARRAARSRLLRRIRHVRHPPGDAISAWTRRSSPATAWSPAGARSTAGWPMSFRQDFTVFGGSLSRNPRAEDLQDHGPGGAERRAGDRAQRFRRRPHPGGRRVARRLCRSVLAQCAGLGRRAADLGHHGAVRGRRGLFAGDDRLHLHGARTRATCS